MMHSYSVKHYTNFFTYYGFMEYLHVPINHGVMSYFTGGINDPMLSIFVHKFKIIHSVFMSCKLPTK